MYSRRAYFNRQLRRFFPRKYTHLYNIVTAGGCEGFGVATLLYPFVGWLIRGTIVNNAAVFFILGIFFIFCGGYMSHRKIETRRGHLIALVIALFTFYAFTLITMEGFSSLQMATMASPT